MLFIDILGFSISDKPHCPRNVMIQQMPDSDRTDCTCTLHVQLDPPNNVDNRSITGYRVDYPSGSRHIGRSGSEQIIVPIANCKEDVRLNVTAIVCGDITGAVTSGIKLKLISSVTAADIDLSMGEL
jgi:hypothetical protein